MKQFIIVLVVMFAVLAFGQAAYMGLDIIFGPEPLEGQI